MSDTEPFLEWDSQREKLIQKLSKPVEKPPRNDHVKNPYKPLKSKRRCILY